MIMAEWLVLQLPHGTDGPCTWMLAGAQGQALSTPESGTLAQAASQAGGRRVGVIVSSVDVLLTEVELPSKSNVRAQQIVAYALEEQLAADIETLHFAVGTRDPTTGRTVVAVVTRSLMSRWLQELGAAEIDAAVVCGESSLLPDNPGHTVVMLEGDILSLRRAGQYAQALSSEDIGAALDALLGAGLASEHLIVYASPQDWQRRAKEVEAQRSRCASIKVQLLNSGPLPLLAPRLTAGEYINLLCEEFAPKTQHRGGWQRWRLAAILAATLFAVHVGGLAVELLQQHRSERALDAAIGAFARSAVPGESGQGGVRARIEQRLLAAQGDAASGGFMPALAALAQALSGAGGASLQALSFREGALDLKLKANDAASLERIDQTLRNNGWQAELTSGSAVGAGYEGRIQMHSAAPTKHATP
jgi:general secretion pathway protein L